MYKNILVNCFVRVHYIAFLFKLVQLFWSIQQVSLKSFTCQLITLIVSDIIYLEKILLNIDNYYERKKSVSKYISDK